MDYKREMDEKLTQLEIRIAELNNKASQLLTALSFAIAAAVLLLTYHVSFAVKLSLSVWVLSFLPVLFMIRPVKEDGWRNLAWYKEVRNEKRWVLRITLLLVTFGAGAFLWAVWHA